MAITNIFLGLGADGIFLSVIVLLLVNFKIFVLIYAFGNKTGNKWRLFCFLPFFAIMLLFIAAMKVARIPEEETLFYFLFTMFFSVCLFSVFFALPEKKKKIKTEKTDIKPEQKKFVSFLDDKIKAEREKEQIKEDESKQSQIDFSHVKNVIRRMETLPVSLSEKKQLKDLSVLLYRAENGDKTLQKSEINDALSSLLKIMSKYGA